MKKKDITEKECETVDDDPVFEIVGAGAGDVEDGSENHDKYLYGD